MTDRTKHWLKFAVRWGVAAFGIWLVLSNLSFHDRVLLVERDVATGAYELKPFQVLGQPTDDEADFTLLRQTPAGPVQAEVQRADLWVRPDRSAVMATPAQQAGAAPQKYKVLAYRPVDAAHPEGHRGAVVEVLAKDPHTGHNVLLKPAQITDADALTVVSPRVEVGLVRLIREADKSFLVAAVFLLPLNYLLTSLRWNVLLRAVGIRLTQARTFVLNMVGCFYNSFMPGTTGGDLVKAYYASKQTTHRTRAVMSVLVDRGIGLLALIVIGGVAAAYQWDVPDCRRVAVLSAVLVGLAVVGALVFYTPFLRRATGLDFILKRLPMQRFVHKAVEALDLYGHRPGMSLGALLMAFPVHVASILSATLAGYAFGLKLDPIYYWAIVPVITLVGAIPITPQGAGVMEYFAVELTKTHGVTVSQAFALTMSIRLIAMLWNLAGGLFVLRGGFHAPTEQEQHELEIDEPEPGEEAVSGTSNVAAAEPTVPVAPVALHQN